VTADCRKSRDSFQGSRWLGDIVAHSRNPAGDHTSKDRDTNEKNWNVATLFRRGDQERTSNRTGAPKEIEQIQRRASALRIRGGYQQIGGRNGNAESRAIGTNAEDAKYFWS